MHREETQRVKILLVEDAADLAQVIGRELGAAGYQGWDVFGRDVL